MRRKVSETSTLNLLKDISIDVLKLDKGFFRQDESTQKKNILFLKVSLMWHIS